MFFKRHIYKKKIQNRKTFKLLSSGPQMATLLDGNHDHGGTRPRTCTRFFHLALVLLLDWPPSQIFSFDGLTDKILFGKIIPAKGSFQAGSMNWEMNKEQCTGPLHRRLEGGSTSLTKKQVSTRVIALCLLAGERKVVTPVEWQGNP